MIYTAASPEDEAQHVQHHERFLEGLRYVVRAVAAAVRAGGRGACPGGAVRQLQANILSPKGEVSVRVTRSSSKRFDGRDLTLFLRAEAGQVTAPSARVGAESLPPLAKPLTRVVFSPPSVAGLEERAGRGGVLGWENRLDPSS